jgi:hypothetical protein
VSLQAAALQLLSFWLVALSVESRKTGNPSTPCFLSKAGPQSFLYLKKEDTQLCLVWPRELPKLSATYQGPRVN